MDQPESIAKSWIYANRDSRIMVFSFMLPRVIAQSNQKKASNFNFTFS